MRQVVRNALTAIAALASASIIAAALQRAFSLLWPALGARLVGVTDVGTYVGYASLAVSFFICGFIVPRWIRARFPLAWLQLPIACVYAAAIILWELLAGRHAFQRASLPELEILQAMAQPRIPPIDRLRPDLPRSVCEALSLALRANADERIGAREMLGRVVKSPALPRAFLRVWFRWWPKSSDPQVGTAGRRNR